MTWVDFLRRGWKPRPFKVALFRVHLQWKPLLKAGSRKKPQEIQPAVMAG